MEPIRRTLKQCRDIILSMSSSQRLSLIVVTALILGGFGYLMFQGTSRSYAALSWGKAFTTEELMNTEQALIAAGLNDFRREGNRILVPAAETDRYNAALLEGGSIPDDWGSELLKQLDQDGIFTSSAQTQARKEAALARHLRRVIRAISSIDDAHVVWAPTKQRRFPRGNARVTATVYVKPRRGEDLDMQLVQGLRLGVASSVPDLKPSDVVVFDQTRGKAYTAEADSAFDNKLLAHIKHFEEMYNNKLANALSYINDVLITVNVDLEKVKSSVRRTQNLGSKTIDTSSSVKSRNDTFRKQPNHSQPGTRPNQPRNLQTAEASETTSTTTEKEEGINSVPTEITITEEQVLGAMPEAVQVSVAIPEDYYRAVAQKQGNTEGTTQAEKDEFQKAVDAIKQTVMTDVQSVVMRLIPDNSVADNVSVVSYTPVDQEIPEPATSITETFGSILSRWGGAMALGLFALWTLWMLNKSMVKLPEIEEAPVPDLAVHNPEEELLKHQKRVEMEDMKETSLRDELQGVVKDSPELTASVLTKWIQQDD